MRNTLAIVVLTICSSSVFGQKAPELGYVFPPSIRAGETTAVQLGGYDFTPDMQFFVHDPRVSLKVLGPPGRFLIPKPPYWFGPRGRDAASPIAREVPARIAVPTGLPQGLVRWQVANANGSSQTGVFYVSDGVEVLEKRDRDKPQLLNTLPIAVNGRLSRIAEVDRYRFTAKKDGPVTVELFARRLGANFHGLLEVRDDSGRKLADVADTEGLDAAVTLATKAGRSYTVRLHDVDFRGNPANVYRLAFVPGPRVVTTIPAAGRRGETREVEFVGFGVATGQAKLESVKRKITFPAGANRRSFRYALKTDFGTAPAIEIPLSDIAEVTADAMKTRTTDGGANTTGGGVKAQRGPVAPRAKAFASLPAAATARMSSDGSATYVFAAKKGEVWRIDCQSRAIGTRLDVAVTILDAKGKQRATNDDLKGNSDAGLNFKVPADGNYVCRVTDMSGRSGRLDAVYRLSITKPLPSFELTAPQRINVPLTGKATLTIKANRTGGFRGEIAVTLAGLPPDMTVPGDLKIPAGKSSLKVPITRTKNAASHAALIRVTGRATVDGKTVERQVTATAAGNLCPRDLQANTTSAVLLVTTIKPPFSLELVDKNRQRAVHRGTTYRAEFVIKRDKTFTGDVLLQMAAKQGRRRQGIDAPIVTAGPKVDRILFPCFMPEWLETDRTTRMVVLGVAKVRDPKGRIRYLTKPANARITMILEGALLKVAHRAKELTVHTGEAFSVPIVVSRSGKLKLPVNVEFVVPEPLAKLVTCKPVTVQADRSEAVLKVQTRAGVPLSGRWKFAIRATAKEAGQWPVVSLTDVNIQFESPSGTARIGKR